MDAPLIEIRIGDAHGVHSGNVAMFLNFILFLTPNCSQMPISKHFETG